jgi:hypothetical protein
MHIPDATWRAMDDGQKFNYLRQEVDTLRNLIADVGAHVVDLRAILTKLSEKVSNLEGEAAP